MKVSNWSGNVRFSPESIVMPTNVEEVVEVVKMARKRGTKIRVAGSRHSFSRLIESQEILVDLSLMSGLIGIEPDKKQADFLAGTPIHVATEKLFEQGLGLGNQGDIDRQTLAGAFSTGTHGTGLGFASLAGFVSEMEFVDGNGTVHVVNEDTPGDRLNACRVNFGTFGITTRFKIQCQDAYLLRQRSENMPVNDVLARVDEFAANNRHFEFFWFPFSSLAQVKTCNPEKIENRRNPMLRFCSEKILERVAFGAFCKTATMVPALAPAISRLCGAINPPSDFAEPSHRVFPSERNVVFTEMEYAVPIERGVECFKEIMNLIERERIPVFFPVEFRVAGVDRAWVSPMHGRKSAIISIHVYRHFAMKQLFAAAEPVFKKFGGRPHWGKVHHMTRQEIETIYPRWNHFEELRQQYDPGRIFLNPMLESYFTR
ncbi:MAG: hypothetical protein RIQ81_1783 [Pseudomonadota bacterium]|jgi:FAD-linked oxidoreductase